MPSNFNPRTPDGVRQAAVPVSWSERIISIHAPLTGCDRDFALMCPCGHISIHAPLTGCDCGMSVSYTFVLISIHAPLTGCDGYISVVWQDCANFNPRTPDGVRLLNSIVTLSSPYDFNPRTPDGVRQHWVNGSGWSYGISIHAPLTGCDIRTR